jgi:hypothetical protein
VGAGAYLEAWRAAGRFTAPPHPYPYPLTRGLPIDLPPERNAVYVACAGANALYVGSTTRGVAARLREHVRSRPRARWEDLWVIGLVDDVSPFQVLLSEERVGTLISPAENLRPPGK